MPPTADQTARGYHNMWNKAAIRPDRANAARNLAGKAFANEAKYKAVERATGVPMEFIAPAHMRESGMNFAGVLHNGEHILGTGRKTRLVPKGRGPFPAGDEGWVLAAIDAIKLKGLHKIKDWPVEMILFQQERFNGFGYFNRGINSPYVWGWTNLQQRGKYVADGRFDPGAMDAQCGTAAMLKAMAAHSTATAARLEKRQAKLPRDVVDEAVTDATKGDKRKAGGAGAGAVVSGGTKAGTEAPADQPAVDFGHTYVLPLAIVVLAVVAAVFIVRAVRKTNYIRQLAGH
jgi:lysozyme family protein